MLNGTVDSRRASLLSWSSWCAENQPHDIEGGRKMKIIRVWMLASIVFGVGEIYRVWYAFQSSDNISKSIFQLRFWETLLAGNIQKIVGVRVSFEILMPWTQTPFFLKTFAWFTSHHSVDWRSLPGRLFWILDAIFCLCWVYWPKWFFLGLFVN